MNLTPRRLSVVACLSLAAATTDADLLFTIQENGFDVHVTAEGSIDPSAIVFSSSLPMLSGSLFPDSQLAVGSGAADTYFVDPAWLPTGPANIGSGQTGSAPTTNAGDPVLFFFGNSTLVVGLPPGYAGAPISGSSVYANQSFASLGVDQGDYVWTWTTPSLTEKVTIRVIGSNPPPTIVQQPPCVVLAEEGGPPAVFAAAAQDAVAYQWLLDGSPVTDTNGISGATSDTLTVPAELDHVGAYILEVTGAGINTAQSDPAVLAVRPAGTGPSADVTTANTNPGDPSYGVPDGIVDGADLSFYIEIWLSGTP